MLVPWSRYPGELIEEVLAVLLLREHPNGQHFRPSQGDGGIDVLIPTGGDSAINYQIKRFAEGIGPSQQDQIRRSLKRMQKTREEGGTNADECRVAVPLLPSTADNRWLQNYAKRFDFAVNWYGLTHIEGLVSSYPEVIDYFFGNGRERAENAMSNLAELLRDVAHHEQKGILRKQLDGSFQSDQEPEERAAGGPHLEPKDMVAHLSAIQYEINRVDPLYKYEFELLTEDRPLHEKVNLVAALSYGFSENNIIRVSVVARFADALSFRPCPLTVTFAPQSNEDIEQFEQWRRFGTELSIPGRASADLPGGLGDEDLPGIVKLSPMKAPAGTKTRYEVLDSAGQQLEEIVVYGDDFSRGVEVPENHYFSGHDEAEALKIQWWFDVSGGSSHVRFGLSDIDGRQATDINKSLRFASKLRAGNSLRVSLAYGPRAKSSMPLNEEPSVAEWEYVSSLAEDLSAIQEVVQTPVLFPDHTAIEPEKRREINMISLLAQGSTVQLEWDELERMPPPPGISEAQDTGGSPRIAKAMLYIVLELQGQVYNIGTVEVIYESAHVSEVEIEGTRFIELRPGENNRSYYRLLSEAELAEYPPWQ